jgi:uncharacterized protein with HEPN domain
MSRNWRIYLDDILHACEKVGRFTIGMSQADFQQDERTFDAVVRNLEVIGEAAKHVPEQVRQRMPGIEWRKVAGLRDVLSHAYFGIDADILWDIISNKLKSLEDAIRGFLPGA